MPHRCRCGAGPAVRPRGRAARRPCDPEGIMLLSIEPDGSVTDIVRGRQAAVTDFAFPAAVAEAGNRSGSPL
jgi:hypothetical protein